VRVAVVGRWKCWRRTKLGSATNAEAYGQANKINNNFIMTTKIRRKRK